MKKLLSFSYLIFKSKLIRLLNNYKIFIKFKIFNNNLIISNIKNIEIGENFQICPNCTIFSDGIDEGKVIIKNNVALNFNVMINANNKGHIEIKNNVIIGPNTVLRASNHNYTDVNNPIRYQGHAGGRIIIEEGVWIGANCTLLPNIVIGRGSIVGAGSVVTKNIPEYCIVAGVPAKVIKSRK